MTQKWFNFRIIRVTTQLFNHFPSQLNPEIGHPKELLICYHSSQYIGCVRLASLCRPRCVAFFFSRTNVCIYPHSSWEKKFATHRGLPKEAKRTHPYRSRVRPHNTQNPQSGSVLTWEFSIVLLVFLTPYAPFKPCHNNPRSFLINILSRCISCCLF